MSLKENMDTLKEELNSEEKFFESAIRTERFIKRYQKPLIAGIAVLMLSGIAAMGYEMYRDAKIESSNAALSVLLTNPADTAAEETLRADNLQLYALWKYSRAVNQNDSAALESLKSSDAEMIADAAAYEAAVLKGDAAALEAYSKQQGTLYKDLAVLGLAVRFIESGNVEAAHQKISQIPEDSPLYTAAQSLAHYGVK